MPSISSLSLRIPVWSPTLIGFHLPLTTLVDITGKKKQFLTCTEETTRVKFERLRSARLIHADQEISTRHAKALNKTNELMSLLAARLSIIKHII
jgi:hypothetical protein